MEKAELFVPESRTVLRIQAEVQIYKLIKYSAEASEIHYKYSII